MLNLLLTIVAIIAVLAVSFVIKAVVVICEEREETASASDLYTSAVSRHTTSHKKAVA
ncbi:hypothetical protein LQE92_02605 [Lacrimispora sp. NSJ-141]|uniref:Uncharacterized protein n=1 Tax=Lientehia hominis TaxID=2897778 RepID=A0AAP2RFZ5_9FIRM|nr:hypothetical protein [Lientehia hominis]MCD2491519.1 hypothetical protein [Lientehia hominis]